MDKGPNWAGKDGEFKRKPSVFRNTISKEPGAEFPPEKERYHLYVSYACPWAHRTLIVRQLKGLEEIIPFTSVHWLMLEPETKGWRFVTPEENLPGANVTPDPVHEEYKYLHDIYFSQNPDYDGRFTVPVLFDKKQNKIVSNESADIIRMFYHVFDDLLPEPQRSLQLLPDSLRTRIDETNEWVYDTINNGVYKSGSEKAYVPAVTQLFASLDRVEKHLQDSPGPFYFGDRITEADVRLFTTVVRFDPVYVQHFKCNIRDIRSGYPAIHKWLRNLYWNHAAFKETTEFEHIKYHYTRSHLQINRYSITPLGPEPNILGLDEEVPAAAAVRKNKS